MAQGRQQPAESAIALGCLRSQVRCPAGDTQSVLIHTSQNTLLHGDGAPQHPGSRYPGNQLPQHLGHSTAAGCVPRQGMVPGKAGAQGAVQPVQPAALGPFTQPAKAGLELAGSRTCSPARGSALQLGARGTIQAPAAPPASVGSCCTAGGVCNSQEGCVLSKPRSSLRQHRPGSSPAQLTQEGLPRGAGEAAGEQALDDCWSKHYTGGGEWQLWRKTHCYSHR